METTYQDIQITENRNRIKTSSRRIIRALKICRGIIPPVLAIIWLCMNHLPLTISKEIVPHFVQMPLPLSGRLASLLITMIPAGIVIYGITILIRLFRLYQEGIIFQSENVRCLQTLSKVLIVLSFTGVITDPFLSVAMTFHHPHGQRMLSISITGQDVMLLIVGYILATIARVMQEACALQEEQNLTV